MHHHRITETSNRVTRSATDHYVGRGGSMQFSSSASAVAGSNTNQRLPAFSLLFKALLPALRSLELAKWLPESCEVHLRRVRHLTNSKLCSGVAVSDINTLNDLELEGRVTHSKEYVEPSPLLQILRSEAERNCKGLALA